MSGLLKNSGLGEDTHRTTDVQTAKCATSRRVKSRWGRPHGSGQKLGQVWEMPGQNLENLGQKFPNLGRRWKLGAAHWGRGGAETKIRWRWKRRKNDEVDSDENNFLHFQHRRFLSFTTSSFFRRFRRRWFVVSFVAFDASGFSSFTTSSFCVASNVVVSSFPSSLLTPSFFFRRFRCRFFRRFPRFFVAFKVVFCRFRRRRFVVDFAYVFFSRFRRSRKKTTKTTSKVVINDDVGSDERPRLRKWWKKTMSKATKKRQRQSNAATL